MLSTTTTIMMNKVVSHLYYIYITSPLLKKRFGYKRFAINFDFNSSQYYRILDKTLAIKLSLHLICFKIRLYLCNINPHLVNQWFLFCMLLINVTVLWSVNTTNGKNVYQNASQITIREVILFRNCGLFVLIFVKL